MVPRLLQQDRHKHKPGKTRILSLQSTRCFQQEGQGDGGRELSYCIDFWFVSTIVVVLNLSHITSKFHNNYLTIKKQVTHEVLQH